MGNNQTYEKEGYFDSNLSYEDDEGSFPLENAEIMNSSMEMYENYNLPENPNKMPANKYFQAPVCDPQMTLPPQAFGDMLAFQQNCSQMAENPAFSNNSRSESPFWPMDIPKFCPPTPIFPESCIANLEKYN